jgi:hypothetical protein
MQYMQEAGSEAELAGMRAYRDLYGI